LQIGADAGYFGTHAVQHFAKLLQVGFAGGIIDGCSTRSQTGRHDDVRGSGYGSLVHQDVGSFQVGRVDVEKMSVGVVIKLSSKLLQSDKMSIKSSAPDFIASWFGDGSLAIPG